MRKLLVALLVVSAWCGVASAKPSIAILGLEVVVPGAKADPNAVQVARQITEALRQRAKTGTGPYTLAPGSDRELLEEKLSGNCDNEAPACMAAVGERMATDVLLFGKLEQSSSAGHAGYQVSLKLLDVGRKAVVRAMTDVVPLTDATSAQALGLWTRKAYAKITGTDGRGTLVVRVAGVDRGTVLLDSVEKASLAGGRAVIGELAEGRYLLGIEVAGYARWEQAVVIRAGETTTVEAGLERAAGPAPAARGAHGCGCDASSPPAAGTLAIWLAMLGLWWRRPRRA